MAIPIWEHISQALRSRPRIAQVVGPSGLAFTYTAACDVHGLSEPGTLSTLSISPNPQTLLANEKWRQYGSVRMGLSVYRTPNRRRDPAAAAVSPPASSIPLASRPTARK